MVKSSFLSTPLIFSVTFTDEELTTFSSTDTGTFYRFEFDIIERGTLLTFIPRSDQNETTASNSVSFDIIIRNPLLIIFYAAALAFIDSITFLIPIHTVKSVNISTTLP